MSLTQRLFCSAAATVMFDFLTKECRIGTTSCTDFPPGSHASVQNNALVPSPMRMKVAALKMANASRSSSAGISAHGRGSEAHRSQGQRQRSVVPKSFRLSTPRPSFSVGWHTLDQGRRQWPPFTSASTVDDIQRPLI
jgi:hypothetical protein